MFLWCPIVVVSFCFPFSKVFLVRLLLRRAVSFFFFVFPSQYFVRLLAWLPAPTTPPQPATPPPPIHNSRSSGSPPAIGYPLLLLLCRNFFMGGDGWDMWDVCECREFSFSTNSAQERATRPLSNHKVPRDVPTQTDRSSSPASDLHSDSRSLPSGCHCQAG